MQQHPGAPGAGWPHVAAAAASTRTTVVAITPALSWLVIARSPPSIPPAIHRRAPPTTSGPRPDVASRLLGLGAALHRATPEIGAIAHRLDVGVGLLGDLVGAERSAPLVQHRHDLRT